MKSKPFSNLAISLSGGGYRATSFHLGSLSYLYSIHYDNKPLLHRLKIISTISGGTLTGVMYALKLAQGKDFAACFDKLYQLMSEDKLVDKALEKLNAPHTWSNKHKTRDLINAFSEVYNDSFYEQATFDTLYTGEPTHLNDAIFGSSEFTYGKQFRFQGNGYQGKFGNYFLNLSSDASKYIRLADAAAASSCFPGGFEPMIMPADFGNGPTGDINKIWKEKCYQTTAIMDGGIIDNQGIEGVKLAENRNSKDDNDFIGTYIISDVSSQKMEPYPVPILAEHWFKNLFTIRYINITAILSIIMFVIFLSLSWLSNLALIVGTVVMTFCGMWLLIYALTNHYLRKEISGIFGRKDSSELIDHLKVINKTPLYILFYLVKFRATSVMKMVTDVFLRRIRSLQIDALYNSKDWVYRIISNNIYGLQANDEMSTKAKKVIQHANTMGTTLWFSIQNKNNGMLDDLITSGQMTICFNLKKYIDEIRSEKNPDAVWTILSETEQNLIINLEESLQSDWNKFMNNPYWLLKTMQVPHKTVA